MSCNTNGTIHGPGPDSYRSLPQIYAIVLKRPLCYCSTCLFQLDDVTRSWVLVRSCDGLEARAEVLNACITVAHIQVKFKYERMVH